MAASESAKAYFLEEYKQLRAEILLTTADVRALERYVGVACAGIWAWAATHPTGNRALLLLLLTLPVLLTCAGALRAYAYSLDFVEFHKYLLGVEATLLAEDSDSKLARGGWEHFSEAKFGRGHFNKFTWSAIVFWAFLLLTSLAALAVVPRFAAPVKPSSVPASPASVGTEHGAHATGAPSA